MSYPTLPLTGILFGYIRVFVCVCVCVPAVLVRVDPPEELDGFLLVVVDGQPAQDVVDVAHDADQDPGGQIAHALDVPNAEQGTEFLSSRNSELKSDVND